MACPILFIHECIRNQLQLMGAKGILSLVTFHKKCDNNKRFDIATWREFLSFSEICVNPEELAVIMRTHATCGKEFHFGTFMECIRGKLNEMREKLVDAAWNKLINHQDNVGYITLDRIKDVYDLKCHPMVMIQQKTKDEAIHDWLKENFALLQKVTPFDFKEYYLLISASIPNDYDFELLFIKAWKIRGDGFDVDIALDNIKVQVYTNRNRIREFFRDYDPLRHRLISREQFAASITNSKLVVDLCDIKAICDQYCMNDDPQYLVCWTAFCDEIDTVFTLKELEKTPLREVLPRPKLNGLTPDRFLKCHVVLDDRREEMANKLIERIKKELYAKRIYVHGSFKDFAQTKTCIGAVGHVTYTQFAQVISSQLNVRLEPDETNLLCEKYDNLNNKTVNYLAFTGDIDPPP